MTSSNASEHSNSALRCISFSNAALTLQWEDSESTLDARMLRAACRCAQCRFERHQAGLALDAPLPVADNDHVTVSGVSSMGYGLQIKFSDGHDRGIYPLAYLRELARTTPSQGTGG